MKKRITKNRIKQVQLQKQPYLAKVVDFNLTPEQNAKYYPDGPPFLDGEVILMLGEIEQMPGHVAVVKRDGKVHFGYHAENFRKLTREEA